MTENARLYWLHALTPLHVGAGRGVGYIDLPVMREKVTNWPLVPASVIKGVLRDRHEEQKTAHFELAFGKGGDEHSNSGSLVFTDARIVCLPVRSFYGTFAWCTSPMVLQRLKRDLEFAGVAAPGASLSTLKDDQCQITESSVLADHDGKVLLEDLDLSVLGSKLDDSSWPTFVSEQLFSEADIWTEEFKKRFAIVSENTFNFLCETGTEVSARVRIEDDKKTVASGALWYEESLPAETILAGLVWCDRVFGRNSGDLQPKEFLDTYCQGEPVLQIGGKATVGRGRVRCVFSNGGATK